MKTKATPWLLMELNELHSSMATLNGAVIKKELDDGLKEIQKDIDALAKVGEMDTLRLQMAMDRISRMNEALSNLLKKMSDTAQIISQNIK